MKHAAAVAGSMNFKSPVVIGAAALGLLLFANKAKAATSAVSRVPGSIVRGANGQLYQVGSNGKTLLPVSSSQAAAAGRSNQPSATLNLGSLLSSLFKPSGTAAASATKPIPGAPAASSTKPQTSPASAAAAQKQIAAAKAKQPSVPRSFSDDAKAASGNDAAGFAALEANAAEASRQDAFSALVNSYESDSTLPATDVGAFYGLDAQGMNPFSDFSNPMPTSSVSTADSPYDPSGFNEFALGYGDAQAPDLTDYSGGDGGDYIATYDQWVNQGMPDAYDYGADAGGGGWD